MFWLALSYARKYLLIKTQFMIEKLKEIFIYILEPLRPTKFKNQKLIKKNQAINLTSTGS